MKVTFLGTNGWYDTKTGNTICTLIETNNEYIILDAGNGFYKIAKYIKTEKPIFLFLSHFHLEHIIGLHMLAKFNFSQGIKIYGPKRADKILKKFINSPFTMPFNRLSYKVSIYDIEASDTIKPKFLKKKLLLKHSERCLGYRFELENKTVAYCVDTGPCDNFLKLSENADLLIAECSLKSGKFNKKWGHLNPEMAAKLAKEAKVKKLVLTHFDANEYRNISDRKEAQKSAEKIFCNTCVITDEKNLVL